MATAIDIAAVTVPRWLFGKRSDSSDMPAGCELASPMPTPRRDRASMPKPFANPARPVMIDQPKIEMLKSFVRTHPSARRPRGNENTE